VPERPQPPITIDPLEFFVHWLPGVVAADPLRRQRLADTTATLQFDLIGDGGGSFLLHVEAARRDRPAPIFGSSSISPPGAR
jgi:hypothetical protein